MEKRFCTVMFYESISGSIVSAKKAMVDMEITLFISPFIFV